MEILLRCDLKESVEVYIWSKYAAEDECFEPPTLTAEDFDEYLEKAVLLFNYTNYKPTPATMIDAVKIDSLMDFTENCNLSSNELICSARYIDNVNGLIIVEVKERYDERRKANLVRL